MHDLPITVAAQTLVLCAERALFDPARATLYIADAHFGKAATFRARGLPVPHGTTGATLARLDALIARHRPTHLAFLGDLLHAVEAQAANAQLRVWRARHPDLALTLIVGNHDRHAGMPDPSLGFALCEEPHRFGPFALCHHPQAVPDAYALAGHLHPSFVIRGRGDRARLPCFRFGATSAVLPAFGAFTGGLDGAAEDDAIYVCADDRVIAVPRHTATSRTLRRLG
ncbi:ligase-associated DNA damage response endonuclease PdeM [Chitinasiproducens palmae]|uniref:Metallophosphoesterase, DNA ligase-associated n=1 Tax=Chitinasiproducens palmae TaxID=1770053 RepID=A0A1H2PRK8_9BURK|nr:ligase-associated DNA damage response endonuclease PdeM [Chitinasiproducens palmae]SDV49103.1 metallophosphoesterase, DNA ligase-associated [Chitinasiproducens palmae]